MNARYKGATEVLNECVPYLVYFFRVKLYSPICFRMLLSVCVRVCVCSKNVLLLLLLALLQLSSFSSAFFSLNLNTLSEYIDLCVYAIRTHR